VYNRVSRKDQIKFD